MKKTMKKSALLSSVAMLIVSAIVLTSATYAWFSSSKKVQVTDLQANVKVSTGLLISVDKGQNWGTSFTFSNAVSFKDGWAKASDVGTFNPVSTSDGTDWLKAVYEKGELKEETIDQFGKDFVAVPLWVTGPAKAKVDVKVNFEGTDEQSAKCMKFAILSVDDTDGITIDEDYVKAVAADGSSGTFTGISAPGTVNNKDENDKKNAFIVETGKTINEVAAEGGFTFNIKDDASTTSSMKFVVFVWLEGNDADCAMLQFKPTGENIKFSMSLEIDE